MNCYEGRDFCLLRLIRNLARAADIRIVIAGLAHRDVRPSRDLRMTGGTVRCAYRGARSDRALELGKNLERERLLQRQTVVVE
jgi:hypothetical protein